MSFTVVVPALNEEDNLGPTVETVLREFGADAGVPEVRCRGRRLASWLYVRLVNLLFHERFRYTNGTNIFRTRVLRQIPIRTNGFSYQTEAVVRAVCGGVDWIEVGIELQKRKSGDSK